MLLATQLQNHKHCYHTARKKGIVDTSSWYFWESIKANRHKWIFPTSDEIVTEIIDTEQSISRFCKTIVSPTKTTSF